MPTDIFSIMLQTKQLLECVERQRFINLYLTLHLSVLTNILPFVGIHLIIEYVYLVLCFAYRDWCGLVLVQKRRSRQKISLVSVLLLVYVCVYVLCVSVFCVCQGICTKNFL